MNIGNVVEFIDSQKIICAVILEVKKLRLRLLTENNREIKISASRISHKCPERLDLSSGRSKLVETLKKISDRRKSLIAQIDVRELWEVLNTEQEWIDLPTMTAFCFPEAPTSDHESAVVRALFSNRLYFKFDVDRFFPNSEEKVSQIVAQAEAEEKHKAFIETGGQWLKRAAAGKISEVPDEMRPVIDLIESYYLFDRESKDPATAKEILKQANLESPERIFKLWVKLGIWDENENLDLVANYIPVEFDETVKRAATDLGEAAAGFAVVDERRRDLTHLNLITIDGQSTLDFDDALSLEKNGDHFTIGIHIADVAQGVKKDDPIDREARNRASSIYMPDQKISMVPPSLADDLFSLKAEALRPAISTLIRITPNADVLDYEIIPSLIRVKHQLTYYDVNLVAGEDSAIIALHQIATNFRQKRLASGAVQITLPEINIWLDKENEPQISRVNRESPGRLLIAELMILANWLAARFLSAHDMPSIFRSQPKPKQRLYTDDEGSLFQNWMQRKLLSRFVLSTKPEPHSGLGLDAYVTATSPIRKYFDLVTQRQIRAVIGLDSPYSEAEIDEIIQMVEQPMALIMRLQYRRQRYWLLKYLENKIGGKEEAIVLAKKRNGYAILLKEYMIECHLPKPGVIELKPEDLIQITIQHVNARNDALVVFMG